MREITIHDTTYYYTGTFTDIHIHAPELSWAQELEVIGKIVTQTLKYTDK